VRALLAIGRPVRPVVAARAPQDKEWALLIVLLEDERLVIRLKSPALRVNLFL